MRGAAARRTAETAPRARPSLRNPSIEAARDRYLRSVLARWYGRARRDLPWRRTSDPYRILVSETMLQQTRVAAVVPYYERFTARFPDVRALADAPIDEVLALWAGLGYYRRARHLRSAAEAIVSRHGGAVPEEEDALLALPGIGRYTAGAIRSIAFGLRAPVLDGNVFRVFARFFALEGSWDRPADRAAFWKLAEDLVPKRRPGDFNQAMMELGALVCLPKGPDCAHCPLCARCAARLAGSVDRLPAPRRRPGTEIVRIERYLVEDAAGRILIERRPEGGRMAGLWDLPEAAPRGARPRPIAAFRHSILRFRYEVAVFRARPGAGTKRARGSRGAGGGGSSTERLFVAREDLAAYALTAMAKKAIEAGRSAGPDRPRK